MSDLLVKLDRVISALDDLDDGDFGTEIFALAHAHTFEWRKLLQKEKERVHREEKIKLDDWNLVALLPRDSVEGHRP